MAGVIVEVVIDGVQESITPDFGRAAGGGVDVVVLHRDEIGRAGEIYSPVVLPVAGSGVIGPPVDIVEGDCHAVGRAVPKNDMLSPDVISRDVVKPY